MQKIQYTKRRIFIVKTTRAALVGTANRLHELSGPKGNEQPDTKLRERVRVLEGEMDEMKEEKDKMAQKVEDLTATVMSLVDQGPVGGRARASKSQPRAGPRPSESRPATAAACCWRACELAPQTRGSTLRCIVHRQAG